MLGLRNVRERVQGIEQEWQKRTMQLFTNDQRMQVETAVRRRPGYTVSDEELLDRMRILRQVLFRQGDQIVIREHHPMGREELMITRAWHNNEEFRIFKVLQYLIYQGHDKLSNTDIRYQRNNSNKQGLVLRFSEGTTTTTTTTTMPIPPGVTGMELGIVVLANSDRLLNAIRQEYTEVRVVTPSNKEWIIYSSVPNLSGGTEELRRQAELREEAQRRKEERLQREAQQRQTEQQKRIQEEEEERLRNEAEMDIDQIVEVENQSYRKGLGVIEMSRNWLLIGLNDMVDIEEGELEEEDNDEEVNIWKSRMERRKLVNEIEELERNLKNEKKFENF
ncbi:hypothetical protein C1645_881298 [Glomus cerebriforme]|uniref:Uncharacterized protein n=1 Tax=Glomus cerebriforme TaxID=658196 RepID=A0A397SB81_9GLOM|nr:hypothetical protein C1645_881298 [Glomus cerebriforme]